MRNMHALELHMRSFEDDGTHPPITIEASFQDMTVYKDPDDNYKRLVRQDYAPGTSMKDMPGEIKEDPEFQAAWQKFLEHSEAMKERFGVVLDINDSDARNFLGDLPGGTLTTERGNINKSGNVCVKIPREPGEAYVFTIIDPDVFDTEPGKHKFDPQEVVRNEGDTMDFLKVYGTNLGRKYFALLSQKLHTWRTRRRGSAEDAVE